MYFHFVKLDCQILDSIPENVDCVLSNHLMEDISKCLHLFHDLNFCFKLDNFIFLYNLSHFFINDLRRGRHFNLDGDLYFFDYYLLNWNLNNL